MKPAQILLIVIVVASVFSCGPNEAEIKARKKQLSDSIALVKEKKRQAREEKKERERIHREKIEVGKSVKQTQLNDILSHLNERLEREERKLREINSFQIGRPLAVKERQQRGQKDEIDELKVYISNVKKEISMTKLFNSYDFQFSPQGTINQIFTSAQTGDHSKMKHLLDPYGEFGPRALQLCYVEILTDKGRTEWNNMYVNGRIMGEPLIEGDSAIIEIAVGYASDRLEKIELIKRMDKWYILNVGQPTVAF